MAKMISVSDELKDELDMRKDQSGHTSLDSLIRNTFEKVDRLTAENELLKKKLEEEIEERNSFQFDLNLTILEKERVVKELEKMKKREQEK